MVGMGRLLMGAVREAIERVTERSVCRAASNFIPA